MSATSFILARRESVRNEPDLLQELFFEEAESAPTYSKRECESFAALSSVQELPAQCQEYPSVKVVLQRRNKSNYAVAFAGMSPADASEAMTARETGKLTHAQFQRRLTTRHHAGKW